MTKERSFLFINVLLGRWQTREDLCVLLQTDYRTIDRYIKLFREMCLTNELDSFKLEEQEIYYGIGHITPRKKFRIIIKHGH